MADEEKQKMKDYQGEYRKNMADEQKQSIKKIEINAIKINIIT